ncbi:recombinase family protein [Sutcliffiella horikoshii]
MFEKYALEKCGYRKIASNLNTQGIKTKSGMEWTVHGVKNHLGK